MNWQPLWEGLKEPLRLIVLAVISWLITYVVPGVQDPTWNAILILVLRAIDKIAYEYGKEDRGSLFASLKLPF